MDKVSKMYLGGLAVLASASIIVGICKTEPVREYLQDLKKEYSPSHLVDKLFDDVGKRR